MFALAYELPEILRRFWRLPGSLALLLLISLTVSVVVYVPVTLVLHGELYSKMCVQDNKRWCELLRLDDLAAFGK